MSKSRNLPYFPVKTDLVTASGINLFSDKPKTGLWLLVGSQPAETLGKWDCLTLHAVLLERSNALLIVSHGG